MINYRNKQTYFGAVDYHTGEFLIKAYPKGNSDLKIEFLQYLQTQSPEQRLVVIWDRASYHRSEQMQQYLEQANAGKVETDWQLYCLRFAPNAPQRSSHRRHLATSEDLCSTTPLSMSILQIFEAIVYATSRWSSVLFPQITLLWITYNSRADCYSSELSYPTITSLVPICIIRTESHLLPSIQIRFDRFQFFLNQAHGIAA